MNLVVFFSLLAVSITSAQYGDVALSPSLPPAHQPPNVQLNNSSQLPVAPKLRAPPTPKWVEKLNKQNNSHENGSGFETPKKDSTQENSGDHSGFVESSGKDQEDAPSGSGSGSGLESDASGQSAPKNDFDAIMQTMDQEAADNGVTCPSDIMFILDATSSVKGIYEEYIKYILKVIEGLEISSTVDRVGVIVYSSENKHKEKIKIGQYNTMVELRAAVKALPFFSGITATGKALKFASEQTKDRRDDIKLHYVVLTDGYSYDMIEPGARQLHNVPNSVVYAVSIGETFLKAELEIITGDVENVFHGESSYGALVKNIKGCRNNVMFQRDQEIETATVRYIPTATDSQGRNLIPVARMTKYGMIHFNDKASEKEIEKAWKALRRNDRFIAPTTEEPFLTTDCVYDVGVIFDASGSLFKNFQNQLSMAEILIDQLPISENQTRVSIVQFAGKTKTRVLSRFSDESTKHELKKKINTANFYSGTTFTNHALLKMAELFTEGQRKDAKHSLIIFTDGYSAEDTSEGIEALKLLGITIYTVGVSADGVNLNVNELEEMASSPDHYYEAKEFNYVLNRFPTTKYC